ncbi:GAF domain-containing SpoIIE family protein phosphatase [Marinobacter salsuginis]|jgi:phosphoserine phosphatase RsbU/P|uniref:GAF domain-containing SpoIIE family protein phosphatase n=1 Tax=Marinobacter salsuginis TaxID=418719 RepID=UPI00273F5443|nr:SpoIIE family protein phosphatase [Marinobacter salsuginis]
MIEQLDMILGNDWRYTAIAFVVVVLLIAMLLVYRRERRGQAYAFEKLAFSKTQLARQLHSSASDTRAMLDQASLVVMVFDRDAITLRFANRQALELFGCRTVSELSEMVLMRPDAWQPEPFTLIDFENWILRARIAGAEPREWLFTDAQGNGVWVEGTIGNTVFEGRAAQILTATNIHSFKIARSADQLRTRSLVGINNDLPIEQVLESLSKLISVRCMGAVGQFSLYDEQRGVLVNVGTSSFAMTLKECLPSVPATYGATSIGTAAHTKERVVCESVGSDHRWQGYTHLLMKLSFSSAWSEPVIGQNGRLLGVFTVFTPRPQRPDAEYIDTLSSIVSMAGLAIERKTWRESLESAASSEAFIRRLGVEIVNLPTGHTFVAGLTMLLQKVLHQYELGVVSLWERAVDKDDLLPIAQVSQSAGQLASASQTEFEGRHAVDSDTLRSSLGQGPYQYLMPDESVYQALNPGTDPKPVLALPLYSDADKNELIGVLVVQSQFFYVPQGIIEHLVVIGTIVRTALLNNRLVKTLSTTADLEKQQRHKLESELAVARSIQMSMVPGAGTFSECYKDWTIEAWLQPAKAVGGDLYEFIRLQNGKVLLAVGDVSDKGAPAALFMARTVSLLNYLARTHSGDLSTIAQLLNDELCRANDACMFVTLCLARLDIGTGDISWLNAGHSAPMHLGPSTGALYWEGDSGPPLGLYEDVTYSSNRATLFPQETLVIYSDGVTEAFNPQSEEFGDERLLQAGNSVSMSSGAPILLLKESLARFTGPAKQSDDITIMTIQHHGVGR